MWWKQAVLLAVLVGAAAPAASVEAHGWSFTVVQSATYVGALAAGTGEACVAPDDVDPYLAELVAWARPADGVRCAVAGAVTCHPMESAPPTVQRVASPANFPNAGAGGACFRGAEVRPGDHVEVTLTDRVVSAAGLEVAFGVCVVPSNYTTPCRPEVAAEGSQDLVFGSGTVRFDATVRGCVFVFVMLNEGLEPRPATTGEARFTLQTHEQPRRCPGAPVDEQEPPVPEPCPPLPRQAREDDRLRAPLALAEGLLCPPPTPPPPPDPRPILQPVVDLVEAVSPVVRDVGRQAGQALQDAQGSVAGAVRAAQDALLPPNPPAQGH